MNIKIKIDKKLNRFVNNDEKDKAIIYLNRTLQEKVEQGSSSEQELDQVITDFIKHSNMKLKFYHRRLFQILGLVVLLFGAFIFAMWNPIWKLSDQSSYLKENGFQKEGATYNKIATKKLTLTDEIIANNTVFANYSSGNVVEITYEFDMNLEGWEGPYYSCNYQTYFNEQPLWSSSSFPAASYNSLGNSAPFRDTMFNSGAQKDLETTCNAMVEFSNNQETNQDFAKVDKTQDSSAK